MAGLTGMMQVWGGRLSPRSHKNEGISPGSLLLCEARSLLWSKRASIGMLAGVLGLLTLAAHSLPGPVYHARVEIQFESLQGVAPPNENTAQQLARAASDSLGDTATLHRLAQQIEADRTRADVFGVKSMLRMLTLAPASIEPASEKRREDSIKDLRSQITVDRTEDGLAVSATARASDSAATLANMLAGEIVERFDRRPVTTLVEPESSSSTATPSQATASRLDSEQHSVAVSADPADEKLLRQMNGELTAIHARIATLRQRTELLHRVQVTGQLSRTTLQSLGSPLIEQLCRQQAELRRARAGLARDLGPRHPTMVRFGQDLTAGERRIRREVERLTEVTSRDLRDALSNETALAGSVRRLQALAKEPNLAPTIQPDQPVAPSDESAQRRVLASEASALPPNVGSVPARVRLSKHTLGTSDQNVTVAVASAFAAVVFGLLAGSLMVLVGEWFRPTVHSAAQLHALLGLPVICLSQKAGRTWRRESATRSATLGDLALAQAPCERVGSARQVLVFQTDRASHDVASDLARSADKLGRRVLLIAGGAENREGAGLTDVLTGRVALDAALVRCPQSTVMKLAGDGLILIDESMHGTWTRTLQQIGHRFDLLVMRAEPQDSRPGGAGTLFQSFDERLLVVRQGHTYSAEVIGPVAHLNELGVQPTGIVLID